MLTSVGVPTVGASATCRIAARERRTPDCNLAAAVTTAKPVSIFVSVRNAHCDEPPEALARNITKRGHPSIIGEFSPNWQAAEAT